MKIKTKDDVLPKMVKSNNHVDKAISHLKSSMSEIEKYKTNPKVSGVYNSLLKTIKSLESIVDKIEDKTELMDSINENNGEKYKKIFGSNNPTLEFKEGYTKGYNDGYLDGKTNSPFDDQYDWRKYSNKK